MPHIAVGGIPLPRICAEAAVVLTRFQTHNLHPESITGSPMPASRPATRWIALLAVLLLVIAAARILRLTNFEMHHDEVWSIWQTFGTPAQIVHWTPYDWAPLYYLTLGAWRLLVGINPITLRYLSALFALVTAALFYRIGARVSGTRRGGVLAMLVYAALGFGIYQSIILRGYSLLVLLGALAFWQTLTYFERPTLRRGVILGIVLAAMIYTHFSAIFAFAALGMYTLITTPRRTIRWLLPVAVLFVLNIPQLPKQTHYLFGQSNFSMKAPPQALPQNIGILFSDFAGSAAPILLVALVVAIIAYFRRRPTRRPILVFGLWMLIPAWLYVLPPVIRLFTDPINGAYLPRYFWWLMLPFALWISLGVIRASRVVVLGVGILLFSASFVSVPERYQENVPPFMTNFSLLAREARWGDVLLIDPMLADLEPMQWQYYTDAYLPNGIRIVTNPGDYRRVWYVSVDGRQDADLFDELSAGYVPGKFFGPWNFLFRLYEAPPDRAGIAFANGMRFHGAEIVGAPDPAALAFRDGETIRLRLWWSVDTTPALDYSVGVYLFDAQNALRFESNSGPAVLDAPPETSQWQTDRYYVEEREITLPENVQTANYALYLSVYQWWDGQRVDADGLNADRLLPLTHFEIKTWWLP